MPWISRASLALLKASLDAHIGERTRLGQEIVDLKVERDSAHHEYRRLVQGQAALQERVTIAERQAAVAKTAEGLYRMQLNQVQLERAELMTRLIRGIDLKVPVVEAPIAMNPDGGGGVSFDDLGDTAAAVEGYKDMHDIPPSKPAFPSVTES